MTDYKKIKAFLDAAEGLINIKERQAVSMFGKNDSLYIVANGEKIKCLAFVIDDRDLAIILTPDMKVKCVVPGGEVV